jgi:hypothetical protein
VALARLVVLAVAVVVAMWRGAVVVVVAVVVEVEAAVAGGVPFGHPRPPKMSAIISITLSDKVVVLKKKKPSIILCYCTPITTTTPLLPIVMLPPLPTLYPFRLMLIVASLLFCS